MEKQEARLALQKAEDRAGLLAPLSPEIISSLVLTGDLSKLNTVQKVEYYKAMCERVGLDPATQPFKLLNLSGKQVMYCDRSGAQQLNKLHGVSHQRTHSETVEGVFVVYMKASLPGGRFTESSGAVTIANLKGDALANALMKAETKAKRRSTLDLLGLGMLDESEIETIPNAKVVALPDKISDPSVGVSIPTSSPASPGAEAQSEPPQDRPVVASGSATTGKGGSVQPTPSTKAKTSPTRSSKESEDRIPWVKTCLDVIPLLIEKQNRNGAADWYKRARAKFEAGEITEAQFKEIETRLIAGFPPKQVVGEQLELPIGENAPRKRGRPPKTKEAAPAAITEPSPDQTGKPSDEFVEKISKAERLSVLMGIKGEAEKSFAANRLTAPDLKIVMKFLDEKWGELKKKNQIKAAN